MHEIAFTRIIEGVNKAILSMIRYFLAIVRIDDMEGLALAHKRAREEILPKLELTLNADTWKPMVGDNCIWSGRNKKKQCF